MMEQTYKPIVTLMATLIPILVCLIIVLAKIIHIQDKIITLYEEKEDKLMEEFNFMQYERSVSKAFKDSHDRKVREFPNCNWVIFCGPAVKPPYEWPQKGFQGFRYTTKLF